MQNEDWALAYWKWKSRRENRLPVTGRLPTTAPGAESAAPGFFIPTVFSGQKIRKGLDSEPAIGSKIADLFRWSWVSVRV